MYTTRESERLMRLPMYYSLSMEGCEVCDRLSSVLHRILEEIMADSRWKNFVKKLNPYMIKKGILYLKHFGFKEFMVRLSDRIEPEEVALRPLVEKHRASEDELERQRKHPLPRQPLISIAVPLYKTPERFLREMIESVQAQTYSRWELCLADGSPEDESMNRVLREYVKKDSRIRVAG